MDKSWIAKLHNTNEYLNGLNIFLDFAFKKDPTVRCPCPVCGFLKWETRDVVKDHLLCRPFPKNYVIWDLHGEKRLPVASRNEDIVQEMFCFENPMETMINDAFGNHRPTTNIDESQPLGGPDILNEGLREEQSSFREFIDDGNQLLYEGSKYTKLEFLTKLYHIKVLCGLSDKAMKMILDLLRDAFEQAKFPPSFYEAKKTIQKLGLNYTKIDACPNDCMLYLGDEEKNLEICKHCGTSRWNPNHKKKKAAKVLRYFPLKPRLQRLFMCSKTAEHMRWHALENNKDGLMRHPRDGEAWKNFDLIHPEFASDPRNIRLGLASDGTNDESEVSPQDVLGRVLGPEHSGRVRCMGMGAVPTGAFRNTRLRISDLSYSSPNVAVPSSSNPWQEKYNHLESQIQTILSSFKTYVIMKEGKIPEKLAGLFDKPHVNDAPIFHNSPSMPTSPLDTSVGNSSLDARRSSNASNE